MKRPVLKRIVKTVEIVSWTLEYEDVPAEELVIVDVDDGESAAVSPSPPEADPAPPTPVQPLPISTQKEKN
jgi:hypothetical protein